MTITVRPATLVILLVVVLAGAGLWRVLTRSGPQDQRPITLPASFDGLALEPDNYATGPSWAATTRGVIGDTPFAGATYGPTRDTTVINVVAARTDLSGKLDIRLAGPDVRTIGAVRCTDTLSLRPADGSDKRPPTADIRGQMLCWRTSDRLSVSALVVLHPTTQEQLATAVTMLWTQLQ